MGLEAGTYIQDLNQSNPVGATDPKAQGDDHLRLIKSTLKNTLPNASRAFYFNSAENITGNLTVDSADENKLVTADASGGAIAVTLPVSSISTGMFVYFVKTDNSANAVTIAPSSGTINGAANVTLTKQYSGLVCVWTGSTWLAFRFVISGGEGNQDIDGNLNVDGTLTVVGASTLAALTLSGLLTTNGDVLINKHLRQTETLLTDAATIAWDMATTGPNVRINLGASRTLGAATNLKLGQRGHILVVQDGTGGWSLTLNSAYKQPGGQTECDLDKSANGETLFDYEVVTDSGATQVVKLTRRYSEVAKAVGFYREYDLGVVGANTLKTQTHDLGRYPSAVMLYLENTSADLGWAVGDRVLLPSGSVTDSGGGGNTEGVTVVANTANVRVATGINGIAIHNRTSRDFTRITDANWKYILRIYE